LGRWRAAGLALAGVVAAGLVGVWFAVPTARSVMPTRLVVSALVIVLGTGFGARHHAMRTRSALSPSHRRARARFLAACCGVLAFCTLMFWGADLGTKYVAVTS